MRAVSGAAKLIIWQLGNLLIMTKSVRLHPVILDKYTDWHDSLPGSTEDRTLLLSACFEDFADRAIAHATRNRLGSEPFEFEGDI